LTGDGEKQADAGTRGWLATEKRDGQGFEMLRTEEDLPSAAYVLAGGFAACRERGPLARPSPRPGPVGKGLVPFRPRDLDAQRCPSTTNSVASQQAAGYKTLPYAYLQAVRPRSQGRVIDLACWHSLCAHRSCEDPWKQ